MIVVMGIVAWHSNPLPGRIVSQEPPACPARGINAEAIKSSNSVIPPWLVWGASLAILTFFGRSRAIALYGRRIVGGQVVEKLLCNVGVDLLPTLEAWGSGITWKGGRVVLEEANAIAAIDSIAAEERRLATHEAREPLTKVRKAIAQFFELPEMPDPHSASTSTMRRPTPPPGRAPTVPPRVPTPRPPAPQPPTTPLPPPPAPPEPPPPPVPHRGNPLLTADGRLVGAWSYAMHEGEPILLLTPNFRRELISPAVTRAAAVAEARRVTCKIGFERCHLFPLTEAGIRTMRQYLATAVARNLPTAIRVQARIAIGDIDWVLQNFPLT